MDGSIRVSAKTVDDAITEALIQLGVTSDKLEYEVIEKGSAGFLGIGMKQAVIEARRKKGIAEETDILQEIKNEIKKEEISLDKKQVNKEIKKDTKKQDIKAKKGNENISEKTIDLHSKKEEAIKEEKKNLNENIDVEDSIKSEQSTKRVREIVEVAEETKQAVEAFLQDTLKAMGMNVEIVSEVDKDGILCVELSGENMGILIGKRGQTLDSLQYLSNRVANKHQTGYVRVKLDTENYRARREDTLRHLAKNIAHKVKKGRRPVALEPMNPYERRIIHSALQSDPYVTTHSEGEEPYRKVVVTLKR
ncbi:MAG: protein jag [Eubacterium sp.]|nr:protein jag [Eubacterium sp.]